MTRIHLSPLLVTLTLASACIDPQLLVGKDLAPDGGEINEQDAQPQNDAADAQQQTDAGLQPDAATVHPMESHVISSYCDEWSVPAFDRPSMGACKAPTTWLRATSGETGVWGTIDIAADGDDNVYVLSTVQGERVIDDVVYGAEERRTLLLSSYAPATGEHRWTQEIIGGGGRAVTLASDQVCIAASVQSTNVALPNLINPGWDGLEAIVCFGLDGTPRWSRTLRGDLAELRDLAIDNDGNLVVGGSFIDALFVSEDVDVGAAMDDRTGAMPRGDAFVASFSSTGQPRWLASYSSASLDTVERVVTLSDGRIVATGRAGAPLGIEGASRLPIDVRFVVMIGADGNYDWLHELPDVGLIAQNGSLLADETGGVIATYGFDAIERVFRIDSEGDIAGITPTVVVDNVLVASESFDTLYSVVDCYDPDGVTRAPCLVTFDNALNPLAASRYAQHTSYVDGYRYPHLLTRGGSGALYIAYLHEHLDARDELTFLRVETAP